MKAKTRALGTVSEPPKPTRDEVLDLVRWLETYASLDERKALTLKALRWLFWELGK